MIPEISIFGATITTVVLAMDDQVMWLILLKELNNEPRNEISIGLAHFISNNVLPDFSGHPLT